MTQDKQSSRMKEPVSEHLPLPTMQGQALVSWRMLLLFRFIPQGFQIQFLSRPIRKIKLFWSFCIGLVAGYECISLFQ